MLRRAFFANAGRTAAGLWAAASLLRPGRTYAAPLKVPEDGRVGPRDEKFWAQVRRQFPLTRKRAYLNTGGLGASPQVSIDAVEKKIDALEEISEVGHNHKLWQQIKTKAGGVLGCGPDEVCYTRNTTEGANIVCNGLPLRPGDEVITTTHEHVGNTLAWLARQKREGIVVKTFTPSTASADETLTRIESLLSDRTRALSLSHVTCSTGQVLPVEAIGRLARDKGLWYFVDGAQAAGHLPVDVKRIGCHAYATSGHKWLLGPKGTGLLYVSQDAQDAIEAKFVGAYSGSGAWDMISTGEFEFTPTAQRYEYGTVSAPLFVGLEAAVDFVQHIGVDNIWARNHAMAAHLIEGLNRLGATVLSPQAAAEHSGIVTFKIDEMPYQKLQGFLGKEYKLRTRGIYEGGLDGLRISLHLYNSFEEVERVLAGVAAAQKA